MLFVFNINYIYFLQDVYEIVKIFILVSGFLSCTQRYNRVVHFYKLPTVEAGPKKWCTLTEL